MWKYCKEADIQPGKVWDDGRIVSSWHVCDTQVTYAFGRSTQSIVVEFTDCSKEYIKLERP